MLWQRPYHDKLTLSDQGTIELSRWAIRVQCFLILVGDVRQAKSISLTLVSYHKGMGCFSSMFYTLGTNVRQERAACYAVRLPYLH